MSINQFDVRQPVRFRFPAHGVGGRSVFPYVTARVRHRGVSGGIGLDARAYDYAISGVMFSYIEQFALQHVELVRYCGQGQGKN